MDASLSYDVFLSHAGEDGPAVEQLAHRLRTCGHRFRPWLDRWVLTPGDRWQREMVIGLESARACALCFGSGAADGWFHEEMELALDRQAGDPGFRVFCVVLPGASAEHIVGFAKLRHYCNFENGLDHPGEFHRLECSIRGVKPDPDILARLPQQVEDQAERALREIKRLHGQGLLFPSVVEQLQIEIIRKLVLQ